MKAAAITAAFAGTAILAALAGCDRSETSPGGVAAAAGPKPSDTAAGIVAGGAPSDDASSGDAPSGKGPSGKGPAGKERVAIASDLPDGARPVAGVPADGARAVGAGAASDAIRDRSFDDIKFDIEPDAPFFRKMLTPQIEALDGKRIRIRGWILPSFQQSGLTQFVLVRDNMECCFGPGAALFDCILVEMIEDRSTDFSIRPVAVEGRFSIRPFLGPDGKHLAIYHIEGEKVK